MQTIDFIQTSKWIIAQFSDDTKINLFTNKPFTRPEREEPRKLISVLVSASHELASLQERFATHIYAPEILRVFGLDELLNKEFPIQIAEAILGKPESPVGPGGDIRDLLAPIWSKWRIFTSCIEPVEELTIPRDVLNEKDFDDVLTVELRYERDTHPKLETVSESLSNLSTLYAAISTILGMREYSPLVMIFADSGSAVRFDIKGLGEPIKQLKLLIVDLWNKYRHRKAEDYQNNSKALLDGLEVIRQINSLQQKGVFNNEDAERYTRQIIEPALALFEAGALPREIPRVEIVSNQVLLEGIQRKLLPPVLEQANIKEKEIKVKPAKTSLRQTRKHNRKATKE